MSDGSLSDLLPYASRTSTFVSIDVVGSTAMKEGETEHDILYSFLAYHKRVTDLSYSFHGDVIHIAGDGLMCRFQRPEDALRMAGELVRSIADFNRRQNRLRGPFRLRVGVHTGEVMENQSLQPGQMISKTLDIAAKLQQSASPDGVCVSEPTVHQLPANHALSLRRLGWNAALQINVYELSARSKNASASRSLPRPVRLLCLDSEPDEQAVAKKALFGRPIEVFSLYAQNDVALPLAHWKPHVVIVSLDLPWDGGWEMLRSLRSEQKYSDLPVIAASRHTGGDVVQRSFKLGVNGFLRKPLEADQLPKRLDLVLREFYL